MKCLGLLVSLVLLCSYAHGSEPEPKRQALCAEKEWAIGLVSAWHPTQTYRGSKHTRKDVVERLYSVVSSEGSFKKIFELYAVVSGKNWVKGDMMLQILHKTPEDQVGSLVRVILDEIPQDAFFEMLDKEIKPILSFMENRSESQEFYALLPALMNSMFIAKKRGFNSEWIWRGIAQESSAVLRSLGESRLTPDFMTMVLLARESGYREGFLEVMSAVARGDDDFQRAKLSRFILAHMHGFFPKKKNRCGLQSFMHGLSLHYLREGGASLDRPEGVIFAYNDIASVLPLADDRNNLIFQLTEGLHHEVWKQGQRWKLFDYVSRLIQTRNSLDSLFSFYCNLARFDLNKADFMLKYLSLYPKSSINIMFNKIREMDIAVFHHFMTPGNDFDLQQAIDVYLPNLLKGNTEQEIRMAVELASLSARMFPGLNQQYLDFMRQSISGVENLPYEVAEKLFLLGKKLKQDLMRMVMMALGDNSSRISGVDLINKISLWSGINSATAQDKLHDLLVPFSKKLLFSPKFKGNFQELLYYLSQVPVDDLQKDEYLGKAIEQKWPVQLILAYPQILRVFHENPGIVYVVRRYLLGEYRSNQITGLNYFAAWPWADEEYIDHIRRVISFFSLFFSNDKSWAEGIAQRESNQLKSVGSYDEKIKDGSLILFNSIINLSLINKYDVEILFKKMASYFNGYWHYNRPSSAQEFSLFVNCLADLIDNRAMSMSNVDVLIECAAKLCLQYNERDYAQDNTFKFGARCGEVFYQLSRGKVERYKDLMPLMKQLWESVDSNEITMAELMAMFSNLPEQDFQATVSLFSDVLNRLGPLDVEGKKPLTIFARFLCIGDPSLNMELAKVFEYVLAHSLSDNPELFQLIACIKLLPASCALSAEEFNSCMVSQNNLLDFGAYMRKMMSKLLSENNSKISTMAEWNKIFYAGDKNISYCLGLFITSFAQELGLGPQHAILALAEAGLRGPQLRHDPSSPYIIHDVLNKRHTLEFIAYTSLPKIHGELHGVLGELKPYKLEIFGRSIGVDMSSVPAFGPAELRPILEEVKSKIDNGLEGLGDNQVHTRLVDLQEVEKLPFIVKILLAARGVAERNENGSKTYLLEGGNETVGQYSERKLPVIKDIVNTVGNTLLGRLGGPASDLAVSKSKCILNYLTQTHSGDALSLRLFEYFRVWYACQTGQNASMEEYYTGLPSAYKIKTKAGGDFVVAGPQYPVVELMHGAVQKVLKRRFESNSSFMRKLCDLKAGEVMQQASHQIECVRGLLGAKVGITDWELKFDPHGQTIYKNIRGTSLQDMLALFYEDLNFVDFIHQIQREMNKMLAEVQDLDVIDKSFLAVKAALDVNEIYESWCDRSYQDDMDCTGKLASFTPLGVLRLLQAVNVVSVEKDSK